ncbi:MAG: RNA polymerase sigma-70 factor [Saprospiraceae bacterium]
MPENVSDEQLFAALSGGDPTALDELFRRHYADLCRVAYRLLQDGAAAEDVVQELFLRLWEKRESARPVSGVGAYLRRAVRNRSLNYLRDRKRIPTDDTEPPDTGGGADTTLQPLLAAELQQRVDEAINRLPERCRLIYVLSRFEDLTHREIAEQLELSPKTVENQMGRAYKMLREYLAPLLGVAFLLTC